MSLRLDTPPRLGRPTRPESAPVHRSGPLVAVALLAGWLLVGCPPPKQPPKDGGPMGEGGTGDARTDKRACAAGCLIDSEFY